MGDDDDCQFLKHITQNHRVIIANKVEDTEDSKPKDGCR